MDEIDIPLLAFYIQDKPYFLCLGRCLFNVDVACCSYYRIFAYQTASAIDYLIIYSDL